MTIQNREQPLILSGSQAIILCALLLDLAWVIGPANYGNPGIGIVLLLLAGIVLIGTTLTGRLKGDWLALGYTLLIGMLDRAERSPIVGSDVMAATREAVRALTHGHNPYTHVYLTTNPPHSPFPYLPGEVLFYAIPNAVFGQVQSTDKWAGIGVVLLLAGFAFRVGPAIPALVAALYGTFLPAIVRSLDGSNDTALSLLVVLALLLLVLSARPDHWNGTTFYASAVVFAWALLFKELAWLFFPFVIQYLRCVRAPWREYLAVSLGIFVIVVTPFFLWEPVAFIRNQVEGLTFHRQVSGLNLWAALQSLDPSLVQDLAPAIPWIEFAGIVLTLAILLRTPAKTANWAVFQGLAVLSSALILARYTTGSYYTFALAVLCAVVAMA